MIHQYLLILQATALDFYVGLGMCLHQIHNFLIALLLLNLGTILGITGMVIIELFGKQILHWLKLFLVLIIKNLKKTQWGLAFVTAAIQLFKRIKLFKNRLNQIIATKLRENSLGRLILHRRIKVRRKQHKRKKQIRGLVRKDGAYAIFFLSLFAFIPGTPWILIGAWLGFKIKHGFLALLLGALSRVTIITLFSYGVKFII